MNRLFRLIAPLIFALTVLFGVLAPHAAEARKVWKSVPVTWVNTARTSAGIAANPRSLYVEQTTFLNADTDTTGTIFVPDITSPPWYQGPQTRRGPAISGGYAPGDSIVTDTLLVGRITLYADTSFATTLTAMTVITDAVQYHVGLNQPTTVPVAVMHDSTTYTGLGTKTALSFPVFVYLPPRLSAAATGNPLVRTYSNRTSDPITIGGIQGAPRFRFRFINGNSAGQFIDVRAVFEYWADVN